MMRYSRLLVVMGAVGGVAICSAPAVAGPNCRPSCGNYESSARPTTVIPDPNAFTSTGERFSSAASQLTVPVNGAYEQALRFSFTIAGTSYNSVFVNEDGALSFGAALPSRSAGAAALTTAAAVSTATPYIAPFYADLTQHAGSTTGKIYVQFGEDQPFADAMRDGQPIYTGSDVRSAIKFVWYGLTVDDPAAAESVYAEVILTGDNQGNNSFAFRWGAPGGNGVQQGYGSYAGFVFPDQQLVYRGPYATNTSPSVFDMANGVVLNATVGGVPEPATWATMLLGFALVGAALRRRRSSAKPGVVATAQ